MKSTTPRQPCKEKIDFIGGFYHLFLLICSVLLWSGLLFATRAYGQTHADENAASWGSRIVSDITQTGQIMIATIFIFLLSAGITGSCTIKKRPIA